MRPLRNMLAAAIPAGAPLPIAVGPARGLRWMPGAAPGPARGLSVLINRSEPAQLAAAAELADGASCCLDVGAHAGLYSLVFSRHAAQVFAFEPWPRNIAWLHRTLARNHADNVTVLPWAVAAETGIVAFEPGPHHSMGKLSSHGTPVFAISLGDFIERHGVRPSVLKVDVEGAEVDVLLGGLDYLRQRRPALLLSTHNARLREQCLRMVRDLGYSRIRPLNARDLDQADEFRIES